MNPKDLTGDRSRPSPPQGVDQPADDDTDFLRAAELAFSQALRADLFPEDRPSVPAEPSVSESVVELDPGTDKDAEQLVLAECLERLLERAKAGEIVGIAGAVQRSNDESELLMAGRTKPLALIGSIEAVKLLLLQDYMSSET